MNASLSLKEESDRRYSLDYMADSLGQQETATMGMIVEHTSVHMIGLHELKQRWGQFVGLGALLVLLGITAIGSAVTFTLVSILFLGSLMIAAGLAQTVHAIMARHWGGHFFDLLMGLLNCAIGLMMVANPLVAAAAITLLVATFLVLSGTFRLAIGLIIPFHHRFWILFNGLISLVLGLMILTQWPTSSEWVLGLFIGIDMLFNGGTLIALGIAARQFSAEQ